MQVQELIELLRHEHPGAEVYMLVDHHDEVMWPSGEVKAVHVGTVAMESDSPDTISFNLEREGWRRTLTSHGYPSGPVRVVRAVVISP